MYEAEEEVATQEFVATRPLVEYFGGDSPSGSFMSDDSSLAGVCDASNTEIPDRSISALGRLRLFSWKWICRNTNCLRLYRVFKLSDGMIASWSPSIYFCPLKKAWRSLFIPTKLTKWKCKRTILNRSKNTGAKELCAWLAINIAPNWHARKTYEKLSNKLMSKRDDESFMLIYQSEVKARWQKDTFFRDEFARVRKLSVFNQSEIKFFENCCEVYNNFRKILFCSENF